MAEEDALLTAASGARAVPALPAAAAHAEPRLTCPLCSGAVGACGCGWVREGAARWTLPCDGHSAAVSRLAARLAATGTPRPEPPARRRAEYPWAQEAARRNHAGVAAYVLARDYKVDPLTLKRAIERLGVPVLQHVARPRRHPRPQPGWAAEAARRYRDGETRSALCAAYKVGDYVMARVLKAEGVTLRGIRETVRLRNSLARQRERTAAGA